MRRTDTGSVPTCGLSAEQEFLFTEKGVFAARKSCGFCRENNSLFSLISVAERVRKTARRILPESPCTMDLRHASRACMKKLINRSGLCVLALFPNPPNYWTKKSQRNRNFSASLGRWNMLLCNSRRQRYRNQFN